MRLIPYFSCKFWFGEKFDPTLFLWPALIFTEKEKEKRKEPKQ